MLISDGEIDRTITSDALARHLESVVDQWILTPGVRRLLILPPDHTRLQSRAGEITSWLWQRLAGIVDVDVMPALGTHAPLNAEQCRLMFGDAIPPDRLIPHRWREELAQLGELPAEEIESLSGGKFRQPMQVEINRRIVEGGYDLILSVGQVVPHEVMGFANYTKNVCIGAGGKDMIHKSHFMSAVCDYETTMGRVDTPVRRAVDTAFDRFVRPRANVRFLLTVIEETAAGTVHRGLFAGDDAECFRRAAELSGRLNITIVEKPIERCVVYLDPREFHSTWLGNKAIYRTRMALADGGELIVLAPEVRMFGEDAANKNAIMDRLIRRHGYHGCGPTLQAVADDPEMAGNLSAAAHLIHGCSEGRFRITYCPGGGLSRDEIQAVGYEHQPYGSAAETFCIDGLPDGWHDGPDGRPFYFIRNPALGLWATADKFP